MITSAQERFVNALARTFAVQVVRSDSRIPDDVDGLITLDPSGEDVERVRATSLAVLSFTSRLDGPSYPVGPVTFTSSECVPSAVRGHPFRVSHACGFHTLRPQPGERVLATLDGLPVFTASSTDGHRFLRCGLPFPTLEANEHLFDLFSEQRFPLAVPVVEFLRDVTDDQSWHVGLRATLMMDDPNLHWPTYGCIKYDRLAASATTHHYHTAMATVPLDGWYSHPNAARVFRTNPRQLSLLVHGNNHTYAELAQRRTPAECASYLRLAEQRVRRLEARSGVPVSRVMAAPHGACNETMFSALVDAGFEAAVISPGSLRRFNIHRPWISTLGIAATENIRGLPVIPRFRISASCQSRILAAAYLRQPIIPVGHHWDVANGLGLLESTADFINSLGAVEWCDLTTLARSNYATRLRGGELHVRLFSRRVLVPIDAGVRSLRIEKSWTSSSYPDSISVHSDRGRLACERDGEAIYTVLDDQGIIDIKVRTTAPPPHGDLRPGSGVWPMTRRVLGECRDRLHPLRQSLRWRTRTT